MIRYYSTNRRLDGVAGLTPFRGQVSFRDALIQGQAPDEGLFMPEPIPRLFRRRDPRRSRGPPMPEAALLVAEAFLKDELPRDVIRQVVEDSYNYDVPLERVFERMYVMRLDQGPTASFKDFAARMMARLMSRLRDRGEAAQRARGHLGRHGKRRRRGLQRRRGDRRLYPLPAKRGERHAEEAARHDRRERPGPVRGRQVRRLPEPGETGLLRPGAFAVST